MNNRTVNKPFQSIKHDILSDLTENRIEVAIDRIVNSDASEDSVFMFIKRDCEKLTKDSSVDFILALASNQLTRQLSYKSISSLMQRAFNEPNLILSDDHYLKLFHSAIELIGIENIVKRQFTLPINHPERIIKLVDIVDDQTRTEYITLLIKNCVKYFNAELISSLHSNYGELTKVIIQSLDSDQQDIANNLLRFQSKEEQVNVTNWMRCFTGELGHIDYEAGLMTLSQISSNKDYVFSPVLMKDTNEFGSFLSDIHSINSPMEIDFIIAGHHWISGRFKIDNDGNINVLLLDSLGDNGDEIFSDTLAAMQNINNIFTGANIYFSPEKRQNMQLACQVFAIDDVTHLATAERYLSEQYRETGIFGYLADHKKKTTCTIVEHNGMGIPIIECDLPLSFIRSKESSSLLPLIENREHIEGRLPVNKRGQSAYISASSFFKPNASGKLQNTRINERFGKLRDYNAEYLFTHDMENIKSNMRQFTRDEALIKLQQDASSYLPKLR